MPIFSIIKFVVVGDDFIVGPFRRHDTLYGPFFTQRLSPEKLEREVGRVIDEYRVGTVIGAGNVNELGVVTSWRSIGYGVQTPEHARPKIERIVARLYAEGALAVQNLPAP